MTVHVRVDGRVHIDVCVRYTLFSRGTARRLAEMRVCVQRSAAMSCAGCGETEAGGAIFEGADGQCLRCNRPAPATGTPTSASVSEREAKSAELNAQTVAEL
jgi:hypothetical protein